jgi:hypothetical protein
MAVLPSNYLLATPFLSHHHTESRMSDKDTFAWLSGQLRGMLDLCLAIATTHPNPKALRKIFEKISTETAEEIEAGGLPENYQKGLRNISSEVSKALAALDATDQFEAIPPQGAAH